MGIKELLKRRQASPAQEAEAQEMLHNATNEVAILYLQYPRFRTYPLETQDQAWEGTAQNFPPFSENIRKLREVLEISGEIKDKYGEEFERGMNIPLVKVKDVFARSLLADLLLARVKDSLYSREEIFNEAEAMVKELGFQDIFDEGMETITPDDVIKAVLTGKLRLSKTEIEDGGRRRELRKNLLRLARRGGRS